jgi:hypothetical protein
MGRGARVRKMTAPLIFASGTGVLPRERIEVPSLTEVRIELCGRIGSKDSEPVKGFEIPYDRGQPEGCLVDPFLSALRPAARTQALKAL